MPCGCADNKNISKDKLSLDTMKDLSIDEIISLYRQDYVLEELDNKIIPLVYATNCSGSIVLDKSNTSVSGYTPTLSIRDAIAQKFIPASKCLAKVELSLKVFNIVYANDVFVQIRRDSGGFPVGSPNDSNYLGQTTIPYTQLTTAFTNISVPLNVELQDSDLSGVWIVVVSSVYDPNYTGTDTTLYLYLNGNSTGSGLAVKVGTNIWMNLSGMLYYKTFKQTFALPAPVLTTITVAPTTASISVGSTTQLTAVCKDQYGANMTCTLTWSSGSPAIASVNSSGLVTGVAAGGPVNITASASGVTSNLSAITVTTPPPVLTTIEVSPLSITLSPGSIQTFLATPKDQFGGIMTGITITWSVISAAIGTITSAGVFTAGSTAGTTTIRATSGAVFGAATVTVTTTTPVLSTITISPSTVSVAPGNTQTFIATPKDQFGGIMTGITITWSIIDTTIGTITSAGVFTAGSTAGTTTIRAMSGAVFGAASVTVATTPPPQAGGGGMIIIAAVAVLAAAMFMARKPPSPPV